MTDFLREVEVRWTIDVFFIFIFFRCFYLTVLHRLIFLIRGAFVTALHLTIGGKGVFETHERRRHQRSDRLGFRQRQHQPHC